MYLEDVEVQHFFTTRHCGPYAIITDLKRFMKVRRSMTVQECLINLSRFINLSVSIQAMGNIDKT